MSTKSDNDGDGDVKKSHCTRSMMMTVERSPQAHHDGDRYGEMATINPQ